jgi:hypothetical protein
MGVQEAPSGVAVQASKAGDRGIRYKLLAVVQRLLLSGSLPPDKQERVCRCHFSRKAATVTVRRNKTTGHASYSGLETCSNVWACPVCSGRITEKRREQLQYAIGAWKSKGGECYLLTLTFPHQRTDHLPQLVELLRRAADNFNTRKSVRAARDRAGYIGSIRALEVTWSSWHGWHPHFHLLYFCQPGQIETLRAMQSAWTDALVKVGLADRSQLDDMLHGAAGESPAFDVQNGDYAAEYIAKFGHDPSLQSKIETGETWGAAAELTKGASKTGRRLGGITPFTLLSVVARVCEVRGLTRGRAIALFSEFAVAFKNQRQLYWSPRLHKALYMGELFTDAELIELEQGSPDMEKVCELSPDEWRVVLAHRSRDEVLRAAESGGALAVFALIGQLRVRPSVHPPGLSTWRWDDGAYVEGVDAPRLPSGALFKLRQKMEG